MRAPACAVFVVLLGAAATTVVACSPDRHTPPHDSNWADVNASRVDSNDPLCMVARRGDPSIAQMKACTGQMREIRAWGRAPRESPPTPQCPVRVRLLNDGTAVVADTLSIANAFDPVPWDECVPSEYLVGTRKAFRVDDGWLVAYTGMQRGELFWASDDGRSKRTLSHARIAGFARTSSGTVLALAIGRARLGKGGVLAFDRSPLGSSGGSSLESTLSGGIGSDSAGQYAPRLIASIPLEPSPIAFDDNGTLVGFAQGFVFRVNELGEVKNVHYVARNVGRVASIAKGSDGIYYLGLECGVLRLVPDAYEGGYREEWWSARNGASGRWTPCLDN